MPKSSFFDAFWICYFYTRVGGAMYAKRLVTQDVLSKAL